MALINVLLVNGIHWFVGGKPYGLKRLIQAADPTRLEVLMPVILHTGNLTQSLLVVVAHWL